MLAQSALAQSVRRLPWLTDVFCCLRSGREGAWTESAREDVRDRVRLLHAEDVRVALNCFECTFKMCIYVSRSYTTGLSLKMKMTLMGRFERRVRRCATGAAHSGNVGRLHSYVRSLR